ncbi:uncharacterized protein LOC134530086 [Bacillus rossius redtenbacheri]|uniref:uncharacterized protein LOC134530086 n=1 Tax=Bacillus rossius redtenbacheri TaxID=93214 RepID=UPI002FDEF334
MRLRRLAACALCAVCACALAARAAPQQDSNNVFEFPVELVGFPVIVAAVRLANFFRKLGYTLSPRTYAERTRRSAWAPLDAAQVEKQLVAEMGDEVCIYEDVCVRHAEEALRSGAPGNHLPDWSTVLREYESSPPPQREHRLLSVFLGDIVHSPELCRQLAKRGRGCPSAPAV